MNSHQKDVKEFHDAYGLMVRSNPTIPTSKEIELRVNLIQEEAEEFAQASEARDLTAVADALADLLYVVYGAANTYGIDMEPVFSEVHRSNMTKLWDADDLNSFGLAEQKYGELCKRKVGDKFLVTRKSDGKVIKSPSYSPADVANEISLLRP